EASSAMVVSSEIVTYKHYEYRTLAGTLPSDTYIQSKQSHVPMPAGGWMTLRQFYKGTSKN
ncbi:hypothetical protein, partial [Synechococcus lacustris]|uniref:hypothetical protein n=1 Tax=Synechococcus lacustris TaxID=2116544 RepID=UPI0033400F9A